jgi:hypothetical protein
MSVFFTTALVVGTLVRGNVQNVVPKKDYAICLNMVYPSFVHDKAWVKSLRIFQSTISKLDDAWARVG